MLSRGRLRGRIGRRLRWPAALGVVLLLAATLVAAAQTLPLRAPDSAEAFCERARSSFERTGKLARELFAALESLDADGHEITAGRMVAIQQGFEQEAAFLQSALAPSGADEVQAHGAAALTLLIELADPRLLDADSESRADLAQFVQDQLVAARNEARAAAAALRQFDGGCTRRASGRVQLLGRRS